MDNSGTIFKANKYGPSPNEKGGPSTPFGQTLGRVSASGELKNARLVNCRVAHYGGGMG